MSPAHTNAAPGATAPLHAHTGRRVRPIDYALRRIRENWVLKGSVVLSFMGYGGLAALALAGRLPFVLGGMIAFLSLTTWFLLLWWFPVLEQTIRATQEVPGRAWVGKALEAFAITCAAFVHLMMAVMIVIRARA